MTADEIFENAALNWRDNKGVGTAFVPAPLNDKVLVYDILTRLYARSPTSTTVIIVNEFATRREMIEFLTKSAAKLQQISQSHTIFHAFYSINTYIYMQKAPALIARAFIIQILGFRNPNRVQSYENRL